MGGLELALIPDCPQLAAGQSDRGVGQRSAPAAGHTDRLQDRLTWGQDTLTRDQDTLTGCRTHCPECRTH